MTRTRRKRRQDRRRQKHGVTARPRHQLRAGRTGSVHAKKTRPKKREPYKGAQARDVAESVRCPKCGARPGEIHRHGALR